ncbi:GSU2403 family nucleotidyltransferase fold protein [Marinovum sp. 2_MG-2023]|uniref:nucleotidyltransferase family protein n=1 Tax=unclassified Marinovum TaxID=2647166 RepID=UPI0026E45872|nr:MULTISPECIES: GSU2403 family nucleotidyltransferase fold protein [unclassified Marinovum]MDO6731216.1 GSU2403 family nucleotidyltransferase fold protein [Marinovum sp. 2_MG-2023]MDO6780632.1 GSU2403 family nucleotidyltransferase fold protein [Marinovum sp. 1_MG-2023]
MPAQSHSRIAQVAYHDLLRMHLDAMASDLIGSIEERQRNGRSYLYDKFRIGTEMKSRYLGEGTPALRQRLARATALKAEAAERRSAMARLARLLRAEGFIATDRDTGSMLLAFARSGLFRLGGTLVGTGAYALYQGELGVRFGSDELAQTGDMDFASFERLSVALGDQVEETPGDILQSLKFDPVPGLQDRQIWKWRQNHGTAMVEFLTPAFGDERVKPLPALGVSAQALNYLNYLIADPIHAVALYRSGVLVQIPRPERFAIHKLIVADRRRGGPDQMKARKDRGQAAFLIAILAEDRPDDLAAAWQDAQSRGPRWRTRTEASLALMPQTQDILRQLG